MSFDSVDIERIVARVMDRLQTANAAVRSVGTPAAQPAPVSTTRHDGGNATASSFTETVITAEVLHNGLNGANSVRIGPRAILTPSARDFLRAQNIECTREQVGTPAAAIAGGSKTRWQAIISTATPQSDAVIKNLQASGVTWERRLVGLPREAVQQAVNAICRGEAAGAVVFAAQPESIACLANRNPVLRAAAVSNAQGVAAARQNMGVNLLAINPLGKSFFELRTALTAFTTGEPPQIPEGWDK